MVRNALSIVLFFLWFIIGVLEVWTWTPLRSILWGYIPLQEMFVAVLQDTLWIPVALALPFYLAGLMTTIWRQKLLWFVLAGVGTIAALFAMTLYFRILFVFIVLFVVFWMISIAQKSQTPLHTAVYALVLVGLALHYNSQLLPPRPFQQSAQTLSVMSYNISVNRSPEHRENVIKLLQVTTPDIVFIQEINGADRWLFREHLGASYPYQLWSERYEEYNGGVILSRHPFVRQNNINVKTRYASTHTNVNHAEIRFEDEIVHLINCHLYPSGHAFIGLIEGVEDPETFLKKTRKTYQRRLDEAQQILRHVDSLEGAVVLAGDFNDTPDSRLYRLLSRRLQNAFQDAGWGLGTTFGSVRLKPHVPLLIRDRVIDFLRIDHIFCSNHFQVLDARVLPLEASEHKPQWVVLHYSP